MQGYGSGGITFYESSLHMSKYYKLILLILMVILGGSLIHKYTMEKHHPYVPAFKVKDCFVFFNHTDHHPDGIITLVQEYEYVVLWYKEADRRYVGPKEGYVTGIKWLDQHAHHVPCPQGWHGH